MSEQLHPGIHPDADSLNAFSEGALPEHERIQCLAHLAECPRCREVVFLAQECQPAPAASQPVSARWRWLAPAPALAAAAAVCIAAGAVWLYSRQNPGAPARDMVAHVTPAPPTAAPPSAPNATTQQLQFPKPRQNKPASDNRAGAPAPKTMLPDTIQNAPIRAPATAPPTVPAPQKSPSAEIKEERTVAGLSGISATVTDPAGAVIPGAMIKVRQLDGPLTADARTDVTGQVDLPELPAGRYEMQIGAPGFRQTSRQVDLQPREVASIKAQLEIGSVAETVEVTAAVPTIESQAAMVSVKRARKNAQPEGPRPLPSKLPAASTATSGKIMVAVDSAGALYVSRNSGRSWKLVKPVWPGKVRLVQPADPPQGSIAAFQLTTDSGAVWLSRDGGRWYAPPRQR